MPGGSTTADCAWRSESGQSSGNPNANPTTWPACNITTTMTNPSPPPSGIVGRFNSQWLTAWVEIPDNYTCDPDHPTNPLDCWWSVRITNSQPHDRTTWTASIIGNPVRLVPNQP
jgi:hypothetical protein